jgi:hypothetical protein
MLGQVFAICPSRSYKDLLCHPEDDLFGIHQQAPVPSRFHLCLVTDKREGTE